MINITLFFKDKSMFSLKYLDKNKEKSFLMSINDIRRTQMFYLSIITAFFYIIYIGVDFLILADDKLSYALSLHAFIILSLVVSSLLSLTNKLNSFVEYGVTIAVLVAAIGSLAVIKVGITYYIVEVYVIMVWVFVLIGFKFLQALIINLLIVVLQIAFIFSYDIMTYDERVIHFFILSAAFTMGLVGGYLIELYSRINFEKQLEILDMQKKLLEQASNDYLTNLYNRRYFNEVAQDFMNMAQREGKSISLIIIDIDNFKNINDTYGHAMGDKVIQLVASVLKENTRESDIVSRFGGEEFMILLPFTNKNRAYEVAETLRVVFENNPIKTDEDEYIRSTISLGVESIDNNRDKLISDAIHRVDKALYIAKENGKNQTVAY